MADANPQRRAENSVEAGGSTSSSSSTTKEWGEQMRETGREIGQTAQNLTTQGKEMAAEYYEQGRDQVIAWQEQLEKQVREKPLQSLLIAAGIGLLIGLFNRR
jgi:ElaB/YqjD/DUF883 family membrane-anchored ribosome-binding protein